MSAVTFRSGFACLVGRPNAGKSTLLNRILGHKVSIVSDKPQTTRRIIRGILTRPDAQIIFVDTPGIFKPIHKLGSAMVQAATHVLNEVDVVIFVGDGSRMPSEEDKHIGELLNRRCRVPVLLALNKMDLLDAARIERNHIVRATFHQKNPSAFSL